ncbi:hypothetical protein KDAU_02180 [Dictyobacter aurantiacus]|uniref:Uncharacterized protein n=1 Tax=Dictyobacter aurantiacus TaxID=1936993 RepID=A0A401Z7S4_9CHLR|nr:hypothetical protein KDAU_02180 [Dictyobacter aurantiacus]
MTSISTFSNIVFCQRSIAGKAGMQANMPGDMLKRRAPGRGKPSTYGDSGAQPPATPPPSPT